MLDFFYQTTLLKRFLNFIEPNLNVKFLEKNFPFTKKLHKNNDLEVYLAEFFYFIGCNWAVLVFRLIEFSKLDSKVFNLKPLSSKYFRILKNNTILTNKHIK